MMSISNKLAKYCSTNKIIYSEKRKEIVDALESTNQFISAESLWMRILKRNRVKVSVASVYLTLKWLVKIGLAEKNERMGKTSIYRLAAASNPGNHDDHKIWGQIQDSLKQLNSIRSHKNETTIPIMPFYLQYIYNEL